jgi:hypothetical protein
MFETEEEEGDDELETEEEETDDEADYGESWRSQTYCRK